jgi:hypothetical protein
VGKKEVERILRALKRGDLIAVHWLDANESRILSDYFSGGELPNHTVETRVVEYGEFVCVQRGDFSGEPHLIIIKERMDGEVKTCSILLSNIYNIERFDKSTRKKNGSFSSLQVHRRKRTRRFSDGSTKIYRHPLRGVKRDGDE